MKPQNIRRNKMLTSESVAKIAEAMAAVQAKMQPALKDSDNPFFKSKYADLASVSGACRELMGANGIAVIQSPGQCGENQVLLTTRLIHKSGEWLEGTLAIPLPKYDAQAYGSAITYARRYALAAMAGVVTDDDDGNAATKPSAKAVANDTINNPVPHEKKPAPEKLAGPITSVTALKTRIKEVVHEINGCGDSVQFEAYLASKEVKAALTQAERDIPQWMNGGPDMGAQFEPLNTMIARFRNDFNLIENNTIRAG
jgi:hypothetical protein